jgi:hypothetical protein
MLNSLGWHHGSDIGKPAGHSVQWFYVTEAVRLNEEAGESTSKFKSSRIGTKICKRRS